MNAKQLADDLVNLGRLALAFGKVERATYHPDLTPETDATHTVMLSWVACALAARCCLDVGLVAQLVSVHDLPEVYAGDTQTLRIGAEGLASKAEREERATARLEGEFAAGGASWLTRTLALYNAQEIPEARLVRAVDKMCPKLTHLLNGGHAFHVLEMSAAEFEERMARQDRELREYADADEFPELWAVRRELVARISTMLRVREAAA